MKIFTNSYPRSGASTFMNALRGATRHLRPDFIDELYNQEHWINKNHNPVIFLGSYPDDVTPVTIIKNPLDAITSNSFRWSKGHTGNVIHGAIVIDKNQIKRDENLDIEMVRLINHQIDQYLSYIYCYMQNPEKVIGFTYEQIQSHPIECIKNIMFFAGLDSENINESSVKYFMDNPDQPTGEKTAMYYKIREYIESSPRMIEIFNEYNRAIDYIKDKQKQYPIKIGI